MASGYYEFTVPAADERITVRSYLRRKCGLSARSLTVIKFDGGSIVCGDHEVYARDILHGGDIVKVTLPRESCDIIPVKGTPVILFEDAYLLVVNKPADMPVHPTKIHQLDTLANIVSFYQRERGESCIFRALNRLDKDTTGCVLIAKDRIAYSLVQPTVRKEYIAVCEGEIEESGTIDAPIALSPDSKIRRIVSADGARAVTHYEPIAHGAVHTMCRLRLETGRTHQIRCHMSDIGHPLAGDNLYGGSLRYIRRQALHCQTILFTHPISGSEIKLTAELPDDMATIMHKEG